MDLDQADMDLIGAVAAQQQGQPAPEPQAQPAAQPAPQDKPTPQEQATAAVAPKTEQTSASQDPFEFFEVDDGKGNKRAYTPDQLRGITNRYSNLNYQHQTQIAPIQKSVQFLNQLRSQAQAEGLDLNDDQLYSILEASMTAYAKNPTIGNTGQQPNDQAAPGRADVAIETQTGSTSQTPLDEQLAAWEQQNAVSLPPGFKDALSKTGSLEQQIAQLTQMVAQLTQSGAQTAQVAQGQLTQAQQAQADAGRQRLVNNLQRVQNELQLPDEAENDFMAFVQGRGYDVWELMDYNLAKTLATDFKNNQQAPELARFRDMAARRQAFTGNLSPAPGNAGAAPAAPAAGADADFDQLTDAVMSQRADARKM